MTIEELKTGVDELINHYSGWLVMADKDEELLRWEKKIAALEKIKAILVAQWPNE